jgi:hypothetical protein
MSAPSPPSAPCPFLLSQEREVNRTLENIGQLIIKETDTASMASDVNGGLGGIPPGNGVSHVLPPDPPPPPRPTTARIPRAGMCDRSAPTPPATITSYRVAFVLSTASVEGVAPILVGTRPQNSPATARCTAQVIASATRLVAIGWPFRADNV